MARFWVGRGTYWSITTTYTEVTGVASGNQEGTGREGTRKANYLRTFFKVLWPQGSYAAAKSLQSCLTLCDPIDGSPPGSPVLGILQARTLEWVAISFSNA